MTAVNVTGDTQFGAFLEMVPDATIAVDQDGVIVLANAHASLLFGYQRSELIGQPVERLMPDSLHDLRRQQRTASLRDPIRTAPSVRLVGLRRDGSAFPGEILMTSIELDRQLMVTFAVRDISERPEPPVSFRGVVEGAEDAAIGVDREGLIALANPEAEDLFGYSHSELIDHPVDMIVPQTSRDAPTRGGSRDGDRPPNLQVGVGTPLEGRRKDGSEFPVEISLSAVATNDGPLVSAAIRDASDRPETRRERDRAEVQGERDLLESRLHQSHRLESLGQLAGGVAHDFNNLLAAILNYAGFVSEEIEKEIETRPVGTRDRLDAALSDIGQISAAAERAAGLTHQLLAFARREVRNLEVLDINGIVSEIEILLRRTIGEHVELITRGASDLRAVRADRGQIEQILLNLAVNARDAMPNGGTLTVTTENFTVDDEYALLHPVVDAGPYICLRVTDTGTGMDRETLDRAFEPFFSTKPKEKGTGLGLATVYGIVSQTAGMIELHSDIGVGTSVTILLPSVAVPLGTKPESAQSVSRDRGGETILVVEDEELVLDVARRILTHHGYHVLAAHSGAEAMERLDAHPRTIDLLLTDVVMPGATGKEVAELVSQVRPEIRVLFMSGYPESVIASQGVIEQGIRLLSKPFKATDLLEHVRAVLDA